MKNYKRVVLLLCIMLLTGALAGCGWSKKGKDKSENSTKSSEDKAVDEITLDGMVSDALSKMTLKEKIGQLFVVCTDSLDFNAETEVTEKMRKNLEEYKPGGVIFFSYNLKKLFHICVMPPHFKGNYVYFKIGLISQLLFLYSYTPR